MAQSRTAVIAGNNIVVALGLRTAMRGAVTWLRVEGNGWREHEAVCTRKGKPGGFRGHIPA